MIWLWGSAITMALTALTHSVMGERRLITPLMAIDAPLLHIPLARQVLRFAWHLTSLLMLLCAALVVWPHSPAGLVGFAGWLWLAVGLFDAAVTRCKHIGWPLLAGAGALALVGTYS